MINAKNQLTSSFSLDIDTNKNVAAHSFNSVLKKHHSNRISQLLNYLPFFNKNNPVINVLRLNGVIGKVSSLKSGLSLDNLNELIEKAFISPKVSAVCLSINSPGGSPVQSELIASRIINLAKEKKIPVYSFVEDVAASGGYWLACAGGEIYASKSSILGSIGVVSSGFGFEEAIHKLGIERRVYSEGKNKVVLDPFQPAKAQDVKLIKNIQSLIHQHFIDYVKQRRAGRLTQNDDILFNGEFWPGTTAHDYGLIDGIEDMHSFIRRKFGVDAKINYIEGKQSWFKKKLGITTGDIAHQIAETAFDICEQKLLENRFNFK